jgi:hypothetical protein
MGVVASKDQSLQADERTAAFTNETIPYTKKRRTGKINIRIDLITAGSYFVRHLLYWRKPKSLHKSVIRNYLVKARTL